MPCHLRSPVTVQIRDLRRTSLLEWKGLLIFLQVIIKRQWFSVILLICVQAKIVQMKFQNSGLKFFYYLTYLYP